MSWPVSLPPTQQGLEQLETLTSAEDMVKILSVLKRRPAWSQETFVVEQGLDGCIRAAELGLDFGWGQRGSAASPPPRHVLCSGAEDIPVRQD